VDQGIFKITVIENILDKVDHWWWNTFVKRGGKIGNSVVKMTNKIGT
jgi:hypothetical protein